MAKKKNRQRNQMLIVGGVMAAMAIGIGVAAVSVLRETEEGQPVAGDKVAQTPAGPTIAQEPQPKTPIEPKLADDDGRTLWAPPTDGETIALDYLPPDCQMVLHLRPAELLADSQASKTLNALGPVGSQLLGDLETLLGGPLRRFASLVIGLRPGSANTIEPTIVAQPTAPLAAVDGEPLPRGAKLGREAEHAGLGYRIVGPWCYFAPPTEAGKRFVIATRPALHEVLDAGGAPPPLRREMEQLVAASDASQHASLLVAPSFLFTGGKSLLTGSTAALREPLFAETPDDLRAALISVHWSGDGFYWELRGAPAADTTASELSRLLDQRVDRWPNEVQLAVLDTNPTPHGRRVVAQLPLMLGVLAKFARAGVVRRHAVVNGYLPPQAGHNLLLAAELLLAQQSAGATGGGTSVATTPKRIRTVAEKLRQPVSVAFARDTLEMAVRFLSDEMETPIVILGSDLQLDGITKNQSFGLDARDQPAERVLLETLTRANPDKTATGPNDPKQKLVYVVRQQSGGAETIYITTRAAAAKRGEPLPTAFTR